MRYICLLLLLPAIVFGEPVTDLRTLADEEKQRALALIEYRLFSYLVYSRKGVRPENSQEEAKENVDVVMIKNMISILANDFNDWDLRRTLVSLLGIRVGSFLATARNCSILNGRSAIYDMVRYADSKRIRERCIANFGRVWGRSSSGFDNWNGICSTEEEIDMVVKMLATALQQHQRCE